MSIAPVPPVAPLHVVVGAGPVGTATALELARRGLAVRVVTRRGTGPIHPGIELVAADATDGAALAAVAEGAAAIYNCANPAYTRWSTDWPPLAAGMLDAARRTGAGLVTMSNLYGYAPGTLPMTETSPLAPANAKCAVRASMWEAALAAHEAGDVRATEARASDFFGPGVTEAIVGRLTMKPLLAGRTVRVLGDPAALHSVTYIDDVATTLATLGTDERSWGRPWHVPTLPAISQRDLFGRMAAAAGRPAPSVARIPSAALRALGLVSGELRELRHVAYQTRHDFVMSSALTEATFGLAPTAWDRALVATVGWWRGQLDGRPLEVVSAAA